eukprot:scaffold195667_cov21-Tisochrysis_lutea.AAC.1
MLVPLRQRFLCHRFAVLFVRKPGAVCVFMLALLFMDISVNEYVPFPTPNLLLTRHGIHSYPLTGTLLTEAQVLKANYTGYPTYMVNETAELQRSLKEISSWGVSPISMGGEVRPAALCIFICYHTVTMLHRHQVAESRTKMGENQGRESCCAIHSSALLHCYSVTLPPSRQVTDKSG